jgi:septum formation protein
MKRIILASASLGRKNLLIKTGLDFEIIPSDYQEDMSLSLSPRDLAIHLSSGKASAVAWKHDNAMVIGADTFVVFKDKILGKPHTPEKAIEMLEMLNGQIHSAITGFTVIDSVENKSVCGSVETKVYFKNLSHVEIADYVATGEPLDKAGAYAIQGLGKKFVQKIEGSESNVTGLPMEEVTKILKDFGIL